MSAAISQAVPADKGSAALRTAAAGNGRTLSDDILSLVSLPPREELEKRSLLPEPLSADQINAFKAEQLRLSKTLAEIDCRLSGKLEPENVAKLREQLKEAGRCKLDLDHRAAITGAGILSGTILGLLMAAVISPSTPVSGGLLIIFGTMATGTAAANLVTLIPGRLRQFFKANELIFKNEGRPPSTLLKGFMNPLVRLGALFYRGPSSEAARDFDKKIGTVGKMNLSGQTKVQRETIAKEGLQLAKEQTQAELVAVNSRLNTDAGVGEASLMMEELSKRLAVPASSDRQFLEETALKTGQLLSSLEKYRSDRSYPIPHELSALKYFSGVISMLDESHAGEPVKEHFFESFKQVLQARLRRCCLNGKVSDNQHIVP